MASRIYVENLPSDISEEKLKDIFAQVGAVEAVKIQIDLITRHSKGSGYVEMLLDVDAFRAVNCFNGAMLKDKKINLKEAKPFHERAKEILRSRAAVLVQKTEEITRQYTKKLH
jgi:cold-inducible RNA-binding protein